jgi:hypothetical protein
MFLFPENAFQMSKNWGVELFLFFMHLLELIFATVNAFLFTPTSASNTFRLSTSTDIASFKSRCS